LEYDSTFAQAHSGLAWVYWNKNYWREYFSENFMDSVLILADIALSFNDQLSEAHTLRGGYYAMTGKSEQAEKEYDKAIKYNPNDWMAYYYKGRLYVYDDFVEMIDNLQKAASLHRGSQLPDILQNIGWAYIFTGFFEQAKYYAQEVLKLTGDSAKYYFLISDIEFYRENYLGTLDYAEKMLAIDSISSDGYFNMAWSYMLLGQYEEMLEYFKIYLKRREVQGELVLVNMHRIGFAYWVNGYKKEAAYYFEKQIEYSNDQIQLRRWGSEQLLAYYDLAAVYAFLGEKDKAYENLRIFNQKQIMPYWIVWFMNKADPLFDSIRDEPEFQQIARDVEAKYQEEHERVKRWPEEVG